MTCKLRDEVMEWRPNGFAPAVCHLRVYHELGWIPVVVVGELDDNPGMSVTNAVEYLAAELDIRLGAALGYRPFGEGGYILIEHYAATDGRPRAWDRVEMDYDGERYSYRNPQWHPLTGADISAMVGETPAVWRAGAYTRSAVTA